MRLYAALFCLAVAVPATAAQLCPRLTPADAAVLTQEQLEARACRYWKTSRDMTAGGYTREALACFDAAKNVDDLHQERFGSRPRCLSDPPAKPAS
jgi:hypothetical protein